MRTPHTALRLSLVVVAALSGCRIEKPATVVPPPPEVELFTASAAEVARGATVTLSWRTRHATSIELREATTGELGVPVDGLEGNFQARVNAASLFVLVARGPGGSDARAVSVGLSGEGQGELTFQALPPIIPGGSSSTLVWSAPGATTVTLSAAGQPVDIAGQRTSGAVTVSPRFDTTYTLTADGAVKTASVTVQPALLTASVSPAAAEVGDTVTLRWTAAGADQVVVSSPGRGQLFEATTRALIESGSFADVVPPTANGGFVSYEIAAIKGTTRLARTVEVNVGTGVAITRFDAPPVAAAGAFYSVRWETRAADQVELEVDGLTVHRSASAQTAASGLFGFTAPRADFSVELIATNTRGGRATQLAQVDAVGIPTSATLTATPSAVTIGQPVTLAFACLEARRARIVDSRGQVVFSVIGQRAENGTAVVYPNEDTTYTLSADNLLGDPAVTASAAVTVTGPATTVTQFPPTAISGQNVALQTTGELLYGFNHDQVLESAQADFLDISGTGTRVLEAPGNVISVTLPFTTFLWGERLTGPLTISRAGWMAWGAPLIVTTANATTLPDTSGARGLIAPFWDDLTLLAGTSAVYAQVVGDAPDESLIVQWDKLQVGTDADTEVTFQVKVHQRGLVSFQYRTMTLAPAYTSFVVGVQDQTRELGVRWVPTATNTAPADDTALYFFSPVAPPAEVRVVKGASWGGYVKAGDRFTLVSQKAAAFLVPLDLAVTELMFRPSPLVPLGQYLEVINRTSTPLDLSGWELRAPNTPSYQVPAGFLLPPDVPTLVGASTDPAENDDAGVTLSWGASGFALSPDAGVITLGTADAGGDLSYSGPADGGQGVATNLDPGPFVGTTGARAAAKCAATAPFGAQTPQQLGTPGADPGCGFGYLTIAIPSRFVDISDGGTPVLGTPATAVDSKTVPITLAATAGDPAPVTFGARREVVSMSVDGWLVGGSLTTTTSSNTSVTSTTSTTKGKLAVFWDDLQTTANASPASELYWKAFAANEDPATPARHWVFQWAHVRHASTSPVDDLSFEVMLFEDGTVEYHYAEMRSGTTLEYADGNSATVWLERPDGTQALVIGLGDPVIRPRTAFRFVPR